MNDLHAVPPSTATEINGGAHVSQRHESAHKHVSGEAIYTDDRLASANCLHAYVGLSSVAHARIVAMNLDRVRAAEGVVDVVTLEDIPGYTDIGPVFPGDPVFAEDIVQFWGQPLFAVAATTHELARRAARLAEVKYEVLEPILTIGQALARQSFVRPTHEQKRGDAPAAIAAAAQRLQGEIHLGGQEHLYLEGQVALVEPEEDGGMLVYCSNQNPTETQHLVAHVLDIPFNRVTVDMRRMGGGFGGKETNANQWCVIAALLARKTHRPVRIRLARADDMIATGKRHHFLHRYEVGFDREGRIEGLVMEHAGGCGFSPDLSDAIVDRAMFHTDNAYFLPHAHVIGHRCKTHTVSNTAFRGFGGPQGVFSIEYVIEQIARSVGKDPLDVRLLNLYGDAGGRNTTHYGQTIEQHVLPELMTRLERSSDYRARRREIAEYNRNSPVLKRGLAMTPVKFGISFTVTHLNQAGALLHIYNDGSMHLNHGGTEMGQGLFTKVAQIVASEFQVDIDTIQVSATRTDKVPNTSPTAASSGTDLNGMAARDAAQKIKRRMVEFASAHFGATESEIEFLPNRVQVKNQCIRFGDFVKLCWMNRISLSATGYYRTPKIFYDRAKAQGRPFFYFANGAAVAEVVIDTLTGENRLLRADICQDVGDSLNPAIDIGQVEGAFIQGMGWMTTEELVWGADGRLQTVNPASYKIPAIADTPPVFNVELLPDSPNREATIYHSKAVGEPPLLLGIAVWAAIADAIASLSDYRRAPLLDAPATPERVLAAVRTMQGLSAW